MSKILPRHHKGLGSDSPSSFAWIVETSDSPEIRGTGQDSHGIKKLMKDRVFKAGLSLLYPLFDCFVLNLSVVLSYSLYRFLDVGRRVTYDKGNLFLAGLAFSLFYFISGLKSLSIK